MDGSQVLRADSRHTVARSSQPGAGGRIPELDGLRGLAALLIVAFHVRPSWLPGGWLAVDLFFVLSGFLISSILLDHAGKPGFLKAFYVRRGLRIWPIYVLTILTLVLMSRSLPHRPRWSGLWTTLTYTQFVPVDWGGAPRIFTSTLMHTWSLAVEEQFYLLWPPLVLLVGRRWMAGLALALVVTSVAVRTQGWSWVTLLGRIDGLALGGLLACVMRGGRASWLVPRVCGWVGLAGMITLIAMGYAPEPHLPLACPGLWIFAYSLACVGVVGHLVKESGAPHLQPLRWRIPRAIGQISYGLYLYHFVILFTLTQATFSKRIDRLPPTVLFLALALTFVVAAASWRYVEQPLLRWKSLAPYDRGTRPRVGSHLSELPERSEANRLSEAPRTDRAG